MMKIKLITLLSIIFTFSQFSYAQNFKIRFLPYLLERGYEWRINGQILEVDTLQRQLNCNFPNTDTVIFKKGTSYVDTIYTRFIPSEEYVCTISCCDDNFEFISEDNLILENKMWDAVYNDSIPEKIKDSLFTNYTEIFGTVQILVKNLEKSDSLVVIGDLDNFISGQILTKERNSLQTICAIGEMRDKIIRVVFVSMDREQWDNDNGYLEIKPNLEFKELIIFKTATIRSFEGQLATLVFDYKTKNISITFKETP